MYANKKSSRKVVILLVALMLLVGCAIGGTLAWLIAQSNTVTNTFTVGNIKISLSETNASPASQDEGETDLVKSFKMVPGAEIEKDPKVTVSDDSESCWLFVKVIAENGVALTAAAEDTDFISYDIASGWTLVDQNKNVYGREVKADDEEKTFSILANDKVLVLDSVTKDMMDDLTDATQPTLTFQAYAIQSEGLTTGEGDNKTDVTTAAAAWALIPNT